MNISKRKKTLAIGEKIIPAFFARRNFGKVLKDVSTNKDRFYVESNGSPVAVIVPIKIYEQWKNNKESLFRVLTESQNNANLTQQEADDLSLEAVNYARSVKKIESNN